MPQPTLGDVHVNRPMTNWSVGYQQDLADFVADSIFPAIPTPNKSDMYWIYNRGDFFRDQMQKRTDGTPAAGGGYKLTTGSFTTEVWSLLKIIGDQTRANSDSPIQPDRDATQWLTQQSLVHRDSDWSSTYFQTGIWGYERAGASPAVPGTSCLYWSSAGSKPINDIFKAQVAIKKATGYWPNVLVLGANVFMSLLVNASIVDRLKYGQTAPGPVIVKASDLAAMFQVKKVVVMSAIHTTSPSNLTPNSDTDPDTFDFIGGDHALLAYAAPSPGILQPSAGYTFNWTGYTGATAAGTRIKKYRWEVNAADHVEIDSAYSFGLVSKYLGAFFKDIVVPDDL